MESTAPEQAAKCFKCSKSATDPSTTLRQCTRCKKAVYCSKECQSAHWNTHKEGCKRPNYNIKFHLHPGHIKDPEVWRTLSCPSDATFEMLHEALQFAFGWAGSHCYDFAVWDPDYQEPDPVHYRDNVVVNALKWSMEGKPASEPREFKLRIVENPHQKAAFKVDAFHAKLHRKHPLTKEKVANKMKLFQLFDDPEYKDHKMEYHYDFGDNWSHKMTVIGREPYDDSARFKCLDGEGHGVAEDVTIHGWVPLKEAYRTNNPAKEQKEKRHWYETQASNGEPQGLGGGREFEFDRAKVDRVLRLYFGSR